MLLKAQNIRLQYTEDKKTEIVLTSSDNMLQIQKEAAEIKGILSKGKELSVEVKQYKHKRSLDANAYLWVLLSEIAAVLHTTKDELYLIMLERYGVFTHIVVKPNLVDKVKEQWRTVKELGPIEVNGKEGIQLQCYFGSSTYDTKEMSRLIDGIVSECKEIGIETMQPNELAAIKQEWGTQKAS